MPTHLRPHQIVVEAVHCQRLVSRQRGQHKRCRPLRDAQGQAGQQATGQHVVRLLPVQGGAACTALPSQEQPSGSSAAGRACVPPSAQQQARRCPHLIHRQGPVRYQVVLQDRLQQLLVGCQLLWGQLESCGRRDWGSGWGSSHTWLLLAHNAFVSLGRARLIWEWRQ